MRQLLSKEHVNLFTVLFTFVIVSKQCFCLLCFTINAIEKINTEGLFQQNLKWHNSQLLDRFSSSKHQITQKYMAGKNGTFLDPLT